MFQIPDQPVQDCTLNVPGSKSYTHRVLIAAAMSAGECRIANALQSEDTTHTINALRQLGADIRSVGDDLVVHGTGARFRPSAEALFLGNSGTSMRLLISTAGLGQGAYHLTGSERMKMRPVQSLIDSLQALGAEVVSLADNGCPPVRIVGGTLRGGRATVDCSTSSQFLSSLLLAAPGMPEGLLVEVIKGFVSRPYVDLTLDILKRFGISVQRPASNVFQILPGQEYRAGHYRVEPDVSNASYFWAAGAITGSTVKVFGIAGDSLQGDLGILDMFQAMGCRVRRDPDGIAVTGERLRGIDTDMGHMPDMVPTMAVVAAYAQGASTFRNVAHLKAKESDRLAAVITELGRMGIAARSSGMDLTVHGGRPHGAEIETYDDHRIAMSFAVAGLKAPGTRIRDPRCVAKSFPAFWDVFQRMFVNGTSA
jgi:3-phosphoshikimate 1-carboxyvinyltransferase